MTCILTQHPWAAQAHSGITETSSSETQNSSVCCSCEESVSAHWWALVAVHSEQRVPLKTDRCSPLTFWDFSPSGQFTPWLLRLNMGFPSRNFHLHFGRSLFSPWSSMLHEVGERPPLLLCSSQTWVLFIPLLTPRDFLFFSCLETG